MLVVDLMHEFELGILKSIVKHLLRIIHLSILVRLTFSTNGELGNPWAIQSLTSAPAGSPKYLHLV